MGAGTSPADPASADAAAASEPAEPRPGKREPGGSEESLESPEPSGPSADDEQPGATAETDGADGTAGAAGTAETAEPRASDESADPDDPDETGAAGASRRFPSVTRDTARPEGGGRAAPGDAPAPARQWPLLGVLSTAGAGLLIVAVDPFAEAFRIGVMLIGVALLAGAVLRWVVPSVGMLAVRSRFTDLVTYGLMGTLIVLLALMAQPRPWLYVPFLQDVVRFTIR